MVKVTQGFWCNGTRHIRPGWRLNRGGGSLLLHIGGGGYHGRGGRLDGGRRVLLLSISSYWWHGGGGAGLWGYNFFCELGLFKMPGSPIRIVRLIITRSLGGYPTLKLRNLDFEAPCKQGLRAFPQALVFTPQFCLVLEYPPSVLPTMYAPCPQADFF